MNDEIDLLIERYLGGAATDAERSRLESLLSQDAAALDRFLMAIDQDVSLRKLLAFEGNHAASGREAGDPPRATGRPRRRLAGLRAAQPGAQFWGGVGAAAGVLFFVSLLLFTRGENAPRDGGDRARNRSPVAGVGLETAPGKDAVGRLDWRSPAPADPRGGGRPSPLPSSDGGKVERPLEARGVAGARPPEEGAARRNDPGSGRDRAFEDPDRPRSGVPPLGPEPPRRPEQPSGTLVDPGSRTVVLTLQSVQGEAIIRGTEGARPAAAGDVVLPGQGLEVAGRDGRVVARFADGSRLELGPRGVLREIFEGDPGPGSRGKRFFVSQGTVTAEVKKQPPDQPMMVSTPQAVAKVIGTTFKILVEGEEKGQTRLLVKEGKVRFTRSDGRTLDVASGFEAVARAGTEFLARPHDASVGVPRPGLALWLRADQGVLLNGVSVPGWADRSGNGRNASQPVPSSQPMLVRNAVNGHPVLRFDGVDDFLTFPCPVTGLTGMSLFLVSSTLEERSGGVNGSGNAALFWHETEDCGTVLLAPGQNRVRFFFGTGQKQAIFTSMRPASIDRSFAVTTALKRGTEATLFVNGAEMLRIADQRPAIGGCEKVGHIGRGEGDLLTNRQFQGQFEGWTYFSGEIAEVVVYSRAVGEEERRSVEEYLLEKYLPR